MMLQRNLLYTAVTRAKQLVVLVGSPRALGQAVSATGSGRQYTALATRLRLPARRESSPAPDQTPGGGDPGSGRAEAARVARVDPRADSWEHHPRDERHVGKNVAHHLRICVFHKHPEGEGQPALRQRAQPLLAQLIPLRLGQTPGGQGQYPLLLGS